VSDISTLRPSRLSVVNKGLPGLPLVARHQAKLAIASPISARSMAVIVSLLISAAWSIGCFFSFWDFCGCLFLPQVLVALDVDPLLNNIHFPSTPAEFAAESERFSRGGRNPLRGCVSAIDGIALRIRRPCVSEVPNPSSYWTRKGFLAINVQVAVGGEYRVHFLSTMTAGSCHDSTAFFASGLAELLARDDGLPRGYWVAGEDAYIAGERLLTPWPGTNLPWDKDSYNYYHSSSRTFVEQVCGQVVGWWRILWRSVRFSVSRASLILRVCVRLHNFLIGRSSPPPDALLSEDGAGGTGEVIMQDQCDLDDRLRQRMRDRDPCPLRATLTRRLRDQQCHRPA